nr:MAG TPA: hypothetical protein [Caudoviricetes sp.]DAT87999.1 MAG TPA: hypothetical protein [Caudoviricetes sp.]DAW80394.1 MAG TPA: hypothetical protein [Caudoviricetes sp.]
MFLKKIRENHPDSLALFHRSVNFYFTDESEPSLVSSFGQFLFYRRVRTVTRLIWR